jgi:polyisoprenoid-binding protein YceI
VVGRGNYALGHVTLDFATGRGEVTFSGGAGQFSSFRARVDVSHLDGNNWAWDGKFRLGDHDD